VILTQKTPRPIFSAADVGRWFIDKWRARLVDSGFDTFTVAKQMRKQGITLDIALFTLCWRPT